MRKIIFIALMCITTISICSQTYVDLGLPSGTLWKSKNEPGDFYTYAQAEAKFGDKLPAKWQWDELMSNCTWNWTGGGFKVVGKNGNSVFVPAEGCRSSAGHLKCVGSRGYYWVFTPKGIDGALGFYFLSDMRMGVMEDERNGGRSVRLVK